MVQQLEGVKVSTHAVHVVMHVINLSQKNCQVRQNQTARTGGQVWVHMCRSVYNQMADALQTCQRDAG